MSYTTKEPQSEERIQPPPHRGIRGGRHITNKTIPHNNNSSSHPNPRSSLPAPRPKASADTPQAPHLTRHNASQRSGKGRSMLDIRIPRLHRDRENRAIRRLTKPLTTMARKSIPQRASQTKLPHAGTMENFNAKHRTGSRPTATQIRHGAIQQLSFSKHQHQSPRTRYI